MERPSKRVKPASPRSPAPSSRRGLKFCVSPQSIHPTQAIALKAHDPNLSLRITSTEELSPTRASEENLKPGFTLSVWPSQTGETNKLYTELLQFRDDYGLYCQVLHTSLVACLGDAISFVLAMLDHGLRAFASTCESFEETYIGEYAQRPFQSDKASDISYLILLKFIGYLQSELQEEKAQEIESGTEKVAFLERCVSLLVASEQSLIDLLERLGASVEDRKYFASHLRKDLILYRNLQTLFPNESAATTEAKDKDHRNLGSHPFTLLLWTQFQTPLAELTGLNEEFPQPHRKKFHEDILGRVALLLVDLEKKVASGEAGEGNYTTVVPAAIFLIRQFIRRHNKHKRLVKWRQLQAVIPGGKDAIKAPLVIGGKSSKVTASTSKAAVVVYPSED